MNQGGISVSNINEREPVAGAIRQQVFDFIGENACGALKFVGSLEEISCKSK